MVDMFVILITVKISLMYMYVQTDSTAHFKYAQFTICQLYLNKVVSKKINKMVRLQKTQSAKQTRAPANYTFLFYPHPRLFFSMISREDEREGAGWGEEGEEK